jgi:hypothetical protein
MNCEVIKKTYQFSSGDTYVIIDVDCHKEQIIVHTPLFWRIMPFHNRRYWEWMYVKSLAIQHLKKQYRFTNVKEKS